MAQPPLSRRIQETEEELGTRLFDRDARPLALTPAGQLFFEQAVQVIQRADQMRQTMKRFIANERPRLVIGLVPSVLYARLPDVLRRFREVAPEVDLSLVELSSSEQITALKEGRITVGFGRIRHEDPAIVREVLREERLVVAIPPNHDLAQGEDAVDLRAIAALPAIVYPRAPRPSYADQVLLFYNDHGIQPEQIVEVRELQMALVMVAAGGGACIVPESVQRLGREDIAFRPLVQTASVPLIARWRRGERPPKLHKLFGTLIKVYAEWGITLPSALLAEPDLDACPPR